MKSILFSLFIVSISLSNLMGQGVTPNYIELISDDRLMFDMSIMTQQDLNYINDVLKMELVYETANGNIGIFRATQFPIEVPNYGTLSSIIEINNTARDALGQGQNGSTDRDNYDFKSILNSPDGSNTTNNPITNYCSEYIYEVRPDRANVRVGIFDTGVNNDFDVLYHPINVVINNTFLGSQMSDSEAIDDHNHGTHIAHIVQSISGSSENSFIEYIDYKILDGKGRGYMADLIIAVDKAVSRHNVNILNLSLSTVNEESNFFLERFFEELESKNVLIITSAGNNTEEINKNGMGLNYVPANFINVGSLDCSNNISEFSNYGALVGAYLAGEDINSYDRFGTPLEYSGTSQATAILSGLAASLASHHDNFDAYTIKCAIEESIGNQQQSQTTNTVSGPLALEALSGTCGFLSEFGLESNENSNTTIHDFTISPNPASDNITITLSKGTYSIMINDILGKNLFTKNIVAYSSNYTEDLNIQHLSNSGLHYLSIINLETKEVTTKKLVIEK